MPTNWISQLNPQTIPYLRYIPRIALPTIFGDALTYMEQMGVVNKTINEVIENFNKLAKDVLDAVVQAIRDSKLPVYGKLVFNGSAVMSPSNWELENPKEIVDAIKDGCLCILQANCVFNENGVPVYTEGKTQMLVLTQAEQLQINNNEYNLRLTFVNYNDTHIRYAVVNINVNRETAVAETEAFAEIAIATTAHYNKLNNFVKTKVMVYVGETEIPREEGQFIELSENVTETDISEYFICDNEDGMYAPDVTPCVVVDVRSGRAGILRFGGNSNPWLRIYSTGMRVNSDAYGQISELGDRIGEDEDDIAQNATDIATNLGKIEALQDRTSAMARDIDDLSVNSVAYTLQNKDSNAKRIARQNIDALEKNDPTVIGTLTVTNGNGAYVELDTEVSGVKTFLKFVDVSPIVRGLRAPEQADDAATKQYVDSATASVENAVMYTAQVKDENAQAIARNNIGALEKQTPYVIGYVSIANGGKVIELRTMNVDGAKVLMLTGTYGDTIVRNVASPVQDNDAANKAYVDVKTVEAGSTVKYIPQALTDGQQSTARGNIDAAKQTDCVLVGAPEIVLDGTEDDFHVLSAENDTGEALISAQLRVKTEDKKAYFWDAEGAQLMRVEVATGSDDLDAVNFAQLQNATTPLVIAIDSANNRWTLENSFPYPYGLDRVIAAHAAGRPVIAKFAVSDELWTVGYADPICANVRYGMVFQGYDGTAWKRYTVNMDGTVTIRAL